MWIARNKDGTLKLFYNVRPVRINDEWITINYYEDNNYIILSSDLYPNLTWKDEPLEIKQ